MNISPSDYVVPITTRSKLKFHSIIITLNRGNLIPNKEGNPFRETGDNSLLLYFIGWMFSIFSPAA